MSTVLFELDVERQVYVVVRQVGMGYRWSVHRAKQLTYADGSSHFAIGGIIGNGVRRTKIGAVRRAGQFRRAQPVR